jgi:Iap family predicted aminopeptidase
MERPMIRYKIPGVIVLFLFLAVVAVGQVLDPIADFPAEFRTRGMQHVRELCSFGQRIAGTKAEKKTVKYITSVMKEIGLQVRVDTFSYRYFDLKEKEIRIGGIVLHSKNLIFDPYAGDVSYHGDFMFYYPDSSEFRQMNRDYEGKFVITREPADFYRLAYKLPKMIIALSRVEFDSVVRSKARELSVVVKGEVQLLHSCNITGTLTPAAGDGKEAIVSAHWDSYNGPGADDNASGVATMLELARYFSERQKELHTTLRFVSCGAEEMGMLGAMSYVEQHPQELKNCSLVFNIDGVGGLRDTYLEMTGGVKNSSKEKGKITENLYWSHKAMHGLHEDWLWIGDFVMASNVPEKLKKAITETCNALYLPINQSNGMGSDHQIFALAGIPSTNISIAVEPESINHTPADTPDKVHPEGLWMAGRIVAGTIVRY